MSQPVWSLSLGVKAGNYIGFHMFLFSIFFLIVFSLVFPGELFAWGPCIHIQQGISIINEISQFNSIIAPLIQAFPHDFLYGCIAPDIIIGKGSKEKDGHCHNWSVGVALLEEARSDRSISFAYGYLAHLASDIVAHNFFIPNQLFKSAAPKKFGHVYWESRCEEYTHPIYSKIAENIIHTLQEENNRALISTLNKAPTVFHSKKMLYRCFIKIQNKSIWTKTSAMISKNSSKSVGREHFSFLNDLSCKLIKDFLINYGDSTAIKFDPVGSAKLFEAKIMRRIAKRSFPSGSLGRSPFSIPQELLNLT